MCQGMVRFEVQILVSVGRLPIDGEFGGAIIQDVGTDIEHRELHVVFWFDSKFYVRIYAVDMPSELLYIVGADLHKGVIYIAQPDRWAFGRCGKSFLLKKLHI